MFKHIVSGTNGRAVLALAAVLGSAGEIQTALAQDPGGVTVDVGECVKLQSPEDRLACFERQVDAAQNRPESPGASPAARSAAPPAATPPAAPPSAPAAQAQSAPPSAAPYGDTARPREEAPPPIVATVTALEQTVPNALLITLDNGQVWRQNRPQWYPLRPGHRVSLTATRWGSSYRLSAEELNGFIQVERVR